MDEIMIGQCLSGLSALICMTSTSAMSSEIRMQAKADFNRETTGQIYFQPQVPKDAMQGEIWIDSKNGDRFFFHYGTWQSEDLQISVMDAPSY